MKLSEKDITKFQQAVSSVSSYDFSNYSFNSFQRRIEKILNDYNITLRQLIENLKKDYNYLERVVCDITVNTTELFRDVNTWSLLQNALTTIYADKHTLNIWHAGCSSGQEVYSMLILLNELDMLDRANIYATDINETVLHTAMSGQYHYYEMSEYIGNFDLVFNTDNNQKKVNINKYIEISKHKDYVKMNHFLIEKPLFLKHDLVSCQKITDKPFDIIFCRNVLIYFNHKLQNKVVNFFADNLNPDGCLIIGRHEGITGQAACRYNKKDTMYFLAPDNQYETSGT